MRYIGIDSGLTGAVGVVGPQGNFLCVYDAPTVLVKKGKGKRHVYVESAMATILHDILKTWDCRIVVENVHAMPKLHKGGQSVVGMFGMGFGLGLWLGVVAALGAPYERVEPRTWKAAMGLATGADKGKSIILASRLFPAAPLSLKKHDGRAEALLLADWLRRKHESPTK